MGLNSPRFYKDCSGLMKAPPFFARPLAISKIFFAFGVFSGILLKNSWYTFNGTLLVKYIDAMEKGEACMSCFELLPHLS